MNAKASITIVMANIITYDSAIVMAIIITTETEIIIVMAMGRMGACWLLQELIGCVEAGVGAENSILHKWFHQPFGKIKGFWFGVF